MSYNEETILKANEELEKRISSDRGEWKDR